MQRYNISIDDDLGEKMDMFIKEHHTNRSNLISIAVSQYLNAMELMPTLQEQLSEMSKAIDNLKAVN